MKLKGHLSLLAKDYNEVKLHYDKQSVEEILIPRAVKITLETLFRKGFFDISPSAEAVLKGFLSVTRRADLEKVNDDAVQ